MTDDPWGASAPQQQDPWGAATASPAIPAHQMQPPPAEEFWAGGGGAKGFSFDGEPPLRLGGVIVDLPPLKQKTNFDTGELLFWKDGRPRWIMPVHCQTDERVDADDDGVRAHFLEYKKLRAAQDAVKAAGAKQLEIGGSLYLTYLPPKPARGQAKNYAGEYFPPGAAVTAAAHSTPRQLEAKREAQTPGDTALAAGAPMQLAKDLVNAGMTLDQARLLSSLAAGWQNATAAQILPYLVAADEPPF